MNVGNANQHPVRIVLVFAFLLIGVLVLLVHSRVFNTNTYIDINSGDLRVETTVCGLRVWNRIRVTTFSREVRRLGIDVPQSRVWRLARTEQAMLMGTHSHVRLDPVRHDLELLMEIFAVGNVPDHDRLVILESILMSLKKKRPEVEIRDQIKAIEEKVCGED